MAILQKVKSYRKYLHKRRMGPMKYLVNLGIVQLLGEFIGVCCRRL